MTVRFINFGILIFALAMTACASIKPATLNSYSGPEKSDSEVALVRQVSTRLTAIDGDALPKHPDPDNSYYRDIRLLPGRHTLEVSNSWGASVMVSASGSVGGSRSFTVDLKAGHVYELRSDRTHGNVRLYFWIEDVTAGNVVAGTKMGGPDNKELAELQWHSDEKRIVLFSPQFDLTELVFGGDYIPRSDWNETGKALAIRHINDEFASIGILAILDEEDDSGSGCLPDTEVGVALSCGENLLNKYSADYGLFLEVQDHSTSPGMLFARAAAFPLLWQVELALFLNAREDARPPACLSLVDARSGEVDWRHCINRASSWQKDGSAKRNVQALLRGFPLS